MSNDLALPTANCKSVEDLESLIKELTFQHEEKAKRAAELEIANKELAFQKDEKAKRAAELEIANKELAFQKEEKAKRAAELEIANKELAFQNEEMTKHAAELEIANKELDSFTYSVSHDLRAPLRAIDGFSRILEQDYGQKLDKDGIRVIGVIRENSQKMGKLIDDLLGLSRIGRKEIKAADIGMEEMASSAFNELMALNPERKISLKISDLPHVCADPALMKQVCTNLLSNAIKFTRKQESPTIEVASVTDPLSEEKVFSVKDNGIGFDMKFVEKLFGVFERLVDEKEFEGTGCGLAIVRRIIQRHGGRIWAEGTPNIGATFFFSLPTTVCNASDSTAPSTPQTLQRINHQQHRP